MKTLISLISEQTIPNVEMIKELDASITHHILIHSKETTNNAAWIANACKILDNVQMILVNPFDVHDIEKAMNTINFSDGEFVLNLTGGTKLMIAIVTGYMEKIQEVYYLTGKNKDYIQLKPKVDYPVKKLNCKLSLTDYLTANGITLVAGEPYKSQEVAEHFLQFFRTNPLEQFINEMNIFRLHRGKNLNLDKSPLIRPFLTKIGFEPENPTKLNGYENKYLSGEWLEELVFFKLKNELNLNSNDIATNAKVVKDGTENEIDVIFILNNQLYMVECKTSIFDIIVKPNGEETKKNILTETIYKLDSIRQRFGLFSKASIITLSELRDDNFLPLPAFKSHFDRAQLNKIKIVSAKMLNSDLPIFSLI